MAKADSWFPLYVADYRADTMRFTTEQHGAYLLIIMDYWRNGPPPDDDQVLAQITGLPVARWKKHRAVIAPKFQIADGAWKQKRVEHELVKARAVQEALSQKGKAGAAARWGPKGMPDALPEAQAGAIPEDVPRDAPPPSHNPLSTPPGVEAPDGASVPDCPHERIIAMYHEVLPANPRVIEWNDTRRGYLRARWRQKAQPNGRTQGYATVEQGLAFWRHFFEWCGQSEFLTGKSDGRPGKPPFVADLEWLMRPTNFAKVIEGKYHER